LKTVFTHVDDTLRNIITAQQIFAIIE